MAKKKLFTVSSRRMWIPGLLILFAVFLLCICIGSVNVPLSEVIAALGSVFSGEKTGGVNRTIILQVRLPRVLCVACVGAALSLCGAAMQGLLRNPLADGSTLGVSSGASLGAVIAIALGFQVSGFSLGGTTIMAVLFAFLSLIFILALANRIDYGLSTETVILIGVIFSMFANSLISLIVTFSPKHLASITFWTMGSLANCNYQHCALIAAALVIVSAVLLHLCDELDAFAIGEDNALNIGVDVRHTKLTVMIAVSMLIGVCVSIGGTIGFVGLICPHMTRKLVGPVHRRLIPASMLFGAIFLMLADLISRIIVRPLELPIGVVTSLIGSVVFIYIFFGTRKEQ